MLEKCPDLNGCHKEAAQGLANAAGLRCLIRSPSLFVFESLIRNQLRVAIRSRERGKWRGRSVPDDGLTQYASCDQRPAEREFEQIIEACARGSGVHRSDRLHGADPGRDGYGQRVGRARHSQSQLALRTSILEAELGCHSL